jgi:predicted DNA-binding transcriptional regulator AlpA
MEDVEPRKLEVMYTLEDLMQIFQVSRSTLYSLIRDENWPHSKYGTQLRFEEADLDAIKAMHRQRPAEKPLRARSTRIGTERSRTLARNYNLRHGLRETQDPG